MDPDRWQRLNALFHAVLEREPDMRDAFLDAACAEDTSLRDEVQSLLAAYANASVFDRPAHEADPDLVARDEADALVGQRLGPYQVTRLLGRGGMGVVYLGEDTRLHRSVAIKALPTAFTHDDQFRARLRREAVTAAALSHPGIATVFALEEFDGHLYLVQEYIEGHTLREEMREGPVPIPTLLRVASAVAHALAAAHAQGVVHRDLKPENVMRTSSAGIKVVDFGLARFERDDSDAARTRLTRAGSVIGTPGYTSPELLRGDPTDYRADQFSFGVLLYELVTGRHPFAVSDPGSTAARVLEADPAQVASLRPDCPPDLSQIIRRCLSKHPTDRYRTTAGLAADLDAVRTGESTPVAPAPISTPAPPSAATADTTAPFWWWQFHQVAVSAIYGLMLVPVWLVREWIPGRWGLMAFVAAVAVVGVAANLRLHLWFTSRVYPAELVEQRRRSSRWTRASDGVFSILLLAIATVIAPDQAEWAALFIAVAISSALSAYLTEPATTRAAFPPG